MAKLFILIGIPGSGKSTWASKKEAVVCSSDAIRKELFGDEDNQENGRRVFEILHNRVRKNLLSGKDVIFDSTNVASKTRRRTIRQFSGICDEIVAVFFDTPIEEAITRNNARSRVVPLEVITRMHSRLKTPTHEEGFDTIIFVDKDGHEKVM